VVTNTGEVRQEQKLSRFPYLSVGDHDHLRESSILLPIRSTGEEVYNVCNHDRGMSVRLRCLSLFLPVNNISNGKDRRMRWQLQGLFHLDKLVFSERFGSKGSSDEVGVGFRSRGGDLSFPRWFVKRV